MILKFEDYYKVKGGAKDMPEATLEIDTNNLKTKDKDALPMSPTLKKIANKSPEQILKEYAEPSNITTDIFAIAKRIGIEVHNVDFSELEDGKEYIKDSILGAVIDTEHNLSVLLKETLGDSNYYFGKTEKEKANILRRIQRFTLAHEIAHACNDFSGEKKRFRVELRTKLNNVSSDLEAYSEGKEYEANVFAGKLLIPESKLKDIHERLLYPSLDALCEVFDVSHPVMIARLKYLNLPYVLN